jgi:sec-independent protein translocase protein TatA
MNIMLAFLNAPEAIAILAVVVLLFGAKKLPELARGLGQGIKEFKKGSTEAPEETKKV